MDNCVIESNSIVAAGLFNSKYNGLGRDQSGLFFCQKVKTLINPILQEIERISNNYVMYSSWFKEGVIHFKSLSITSYLFSKISQYFWICIGIEKVYFFFCCSPDFFL
jgi:hypothetical protein